MSAGASSRRASSVPHPVRSATFAVASAAFKSVRRRRVSWSTKKPFGASLGRPNSLPTVFATLGDNCNSSGFNPALSPCAMALLSSSSSILLTATAKLLRARALCSSFANASCVARRLLSDSLHAPLLSKEDCSRSNNARALSMLPSSMALVMRKWRSSLKSFATRWCVARISSLLHASISCATESFATILSTASSAPACSSRAITPARTAVRNCAR
mmetsp:Transcript_38047/g.104676  ORF Transcript_38047/g.104676 Transcript_38047/m.104676 type:complete len:217 (-) Transcript_38047:510-1160(-)